MGLTQITKLRYVLEIFYFSLRWGLRGDAQGGVVYFKSCFLANPGSPQILPCVQGPKKSQKMMEPKTLSLFLCSSLLPSASDVSLGHPYQVKRPPWRGGGVGGTITHYCIEGRKQTIPDFRPSGGEQREVRRHLEILSPTDKDCDCEIAPREAFPNISARLRAACATGAE